MAKSHLGSKRRSNFIWESQGKATFGETTFETTNGELYLGQMLMEVIKAMGTVGRRTQ